MSATAALWPPSLASHWSAETRTLGIVGYFDMDANVHVNDRDYIL